VFDEFARHGDLSVFDFLVDFFYDYGLLS